MLRFVEVLCFYQKLDLPTEKGARSGARRGGEGRGGKGKKECFSVLQ